MLPLLLLLLLPLENNEILGHTQVEGNALVIGNVDRLGEPAVAAKPPAPRDDE